MLCVTHVSPDGDSALFAWLVSRFPGQGQEVTHKFINLNTPAPELIAFADFVGDCGGIYDPDRGCFDHHHLLPVEALSTCAARMLFEHLIHNGYKIKYLTPLVLLIWQGDIMSQESAESREVGFHSLLSAYKAEKHTDSEILEFAFRLFDLIAANLKRRHEALADLKEKTVYRSDDGLVIGVVGGGISTTFAAEEMGARLVVWVGKPIENEAGELISRPVGITRLGGAEVTSPHVGELVGAVMKLGIDFFVPGMGPVYEELKTWFRHNAGFFAGRGTGKALDPTPVGVDIAFLSKLVDEVWHR